MATKAKKKMSKDSKTEPLPPYDRGCNQYVELRTLLDSLEVGALRYYLDGTDSAEKDKRFEKLEPALRKVIKLVWGGENLIPCPPGYTSCNGCCVPYSCYFDG